ncbi:MAG: hypothetical protein H6610_04595 [Ignavibacteriales bacterium]|nr:hypothetical protein [Ignavibacteriales bacterium]
MIADLEVKQNLLIKEKEIELLNKDNKYQNLVTRIFIGFSILLIAITLFIFYLYKQKKKHGRILENNIKTIQETESALRKNELELKKHKEQLEFIVKKRTKELENEILERKHTEEDLLVAIERVEAANKTKSVFLENMSHELRTPLVGILGYSELLSSEVESKELKEMAEGINRTGTRLLNTLSMILDLARIESDEFEINITEVNIHEELEGIYNSFKGAVVLKNIDFSLNLSENAKFIYTDKGMFRVIVENLVNNAIKFTKEGSISIKSDINNGFLNISVSDTGIGIKNNEIPIIFQEFKQLSEGTVKAFQGTGLGLSISKRFTEHLSGKLLVESEFGVGSKFTVQLPLN